jgi:hypothetical protein
MKIEETRLESNILHIASELSGNLNFSTLLRQLGLREIADGQATGRRADAG